MNALTNVLIKVFVKGFYRAHSGMFLFLFVALITYCFFIEVLNKTHLAAADITPHHLIIVLAIITSPVVLIFVAILWFAYTLKTHQYIDAELRAAGNQFLHYSSNALPKQIQFGSWLIAQLLLSLPIIIYWCFAFIVGLVYAHYWLPMALIVYILLVAVASAGIHTVQMNAFTSENKSHFTKSILRQWQKPFWSLYLFQILTNQRLGFAMTKILSWSLLAASSYLLFPTEKDLTVGGIIALAIVVTHSYLIFDSFRFEKTFLNFSRNLPYSKPKVYFSWAICYLLLTLPESIWLLLKFEWTRAVTLLVLNLSTAMLYRMVLYKTSPNISVFLRTVFFSFVCFFLAILLNLTIPITALNMILSILLFTKYYYQHDWD